MSLSRIFETPIGGRYEALIPSESTILAQGLDLRDYGVRLASSVRSSNLLVITDNENIEALQAPLSVLLSQMSQPAYVLFIGSKDKEWAGEIRPGASLHAKLVSTERILDALGQLEGARQDPHPHTDPKHEAMPPDGHVGHDMSAMVVDPHAGHNMGAVDPHAGHDMSGMDHSGHGAGSFMSMVAMTEGQPRSRDGLIMESAEVVFGPFHPSLPPGWQLKLILDGDTIDSGTINNLESTENIKITTAAPSAFQVLAWLLRFGDVLGWQNFTNSVRRSLLLQANPEQTSHLQDSLSHLARQVNRNQLVRARLKGLGTYKAQDAMERLVASVNGLATNNPVLPRLSSSQKVMPKLLVGLELGDALLVTASFHHEVLN